MHGRTTTLILALLVGVSAACRSPKQTAPASPAPECVCGTPDAALEGCPHPLCAAGEGNPDNPDCVCGPLSFGRSEA